MAETFKMWGMSTIARGSNLLRMTMAIWPNRWQAKRETAERLKRQNAELVREQPHRKPGPRRLREGCRSRDEGSVRVSLTCR